MIRYFLVIEKMNDQNTAPSQYAVREFENDVTAIKEFRTQVRHDLLKLYNSVHCTIYKGEGPDRTQIFNFDERRNSPRSNTMKFLNRIDMK